MAVVGLPRAALASDESPSGMADMPPQTPVAWQHPPSFYCPISKQCMRDPVVLADGHTYEKRHIERWLRHHNTSPVSGLQLAQKHAFPNHALRNAIEEYFQQIFSAHRRAIRKTIVGPAAQQGFGSNALLLRTIDALMQCSLLVNAELSTGSVLQQIMGEAQLLVGAEAASVFLLDTTGQHLYSTVNSTGSKIMIPATVGIAGHVATTGEAIIIDDAYGDSRFNKGVDAKTGFRTRNIMCVPLMAKKGRVIGVVQLINKTDAGVLTNNGRRADRFGCSAGTTGSCGEAGVGHSDFNADDLQFLRVFASQAATAIASSGVDGEPCQTPHDGAADTPRWRDCCPEQPPALDAAEDGGAKVPNLTAGAPQPAQQLVAANCPLDAGLVKMSTGEVLSKDREDFAGVPEDAGSAAGKLAAPVSFQGEALQEPPSKEAEDEVATKPLALPAEREPKATPMLPVLRRVFKPAQLEEMLARSFDGWDLDALALAQITDNRPLSTLGCYLFQRLGLVEHFGIDRSRLSCFFATIERSYSDANAYHSRAHAASVLHLMHALLAHGGVARAAAPALGWGEEELQGAGEGLAVMACLVATTVRDYGHPGLSNDFLSRTLHERAPLSNGHHADKHHHTAATLQVLQRPECNFLAGLAPGRFRRLHGLVADLVLGTDMGGSTGILGSFAARVAAGTAGGGDAPSEESSPSAGGPRTGFVPATAEDAALLLQVAMKCADVGHLASPWGLHVRWVQRLEEGFLARGDFESSLGLEPAFFPADRDKEGMPDTQASLFESFALPLFQMFVRAVPPAEPLLRAVQANHQHWLALKTRRRLTEVQGYHDSQSCGTGGLFSAEPQDVAGATPGASCSPPHHRRSGRARQRAAKWRALVRCRTPSP